MLLTGLAPRLRRALVTGSKTSCRTARVLLLAGGIAASAAAPASAADRIPRAGAGALLSHACHDAGLEPAALRAWRGAEGARGAAVRALRCVVERLRARHRLAPLRWSPRLAQAAHGHAHDMVRRTYFSHTTPAGGRLFDRLRRYAEPAPGWWIGEVLAWGAGPRSRPIDVLERWLDSPSHRRILLAPQARDIGIGIVFGAPVRATADRSATFVIELGWRATGGPSGPVSWRDAIAGGSHRPLRRRAFGHQSQWLCSNRTPIRRPARRSCDRSGRRAGACTRSRPRQ